LLDADWHPPADALEMTLGVLEADATAAFVQTKRISSPVGMNIFQKYVSLERRDVTTSILKGVRHWVTQSCFQAAAPCFEWMRLHRWGVLPWGT